MAGKKPAFLAEEGAGFSRLQPALWAPRKEAGFGQKKPAFLAKSRSLLAKKPASFGPEGAGLRRLTAGSFRGAQRKEGAGCKPA